MEELKILDVKGILAKSKEEIAETLEVPIETVDDAPSTLQEAQIFYIGSKLRYLFAHVFALASDFHVVVQFFEDYRPKEPMAIDLSIMFSRMLELADTEKHLNYLCDYIFPAGSPHIIAAYEKLHELRINRVAQQKTVDDLIQFSELDFVKHDPVLARAIEQRMLDIAVTWDDVKKVLLKGEWYDYEQYTICLGKAKAFLWDIPDRMLDTDVPASYLQDFPATHELFIEFLDRWLVHARREIALIAIMGVAPLLSSAWQKAYLLLSSRAQDRLETAETFDQYWEVYFSTPTGSPAWTQARKRCAELANTSSEYSQVFETTSNPVTRHDIFRRWKQIISSPEVARDFVCAMRQKGEVFQREAYRLYLELETSLHDLSGMFSECPLEMKAALEEKKILLVKEQAPLITGSEEIDSLFKSDKSDLQLAVLRHRLNQDPDYEEAKKIYLLAYTCYQKNHLRAFAETAQESVLLAAELAESKAEFEEIFNLVENKSVEVIAKNILFERLLEKHVPAE